MYLGIDVGGTKTLLAVFDDHGKIVHEHKIKTPGTYDGLKAAIAQALAGELAGFSFSHACCAVPGWIDFEKGVAVGFGSLPWENVPVQADLQALLPRVKLLIHNDAKLAGLSETLLLHKRYKKALYMTISTGIGGGVITNDVIDSDFANFEPGQMIFDFEGRRQKWEAFASGKALKQRYGKLASEIDDQATWQEYAKTLVPGFENLLATVQPDAVIVGGGVGAHFEKFQPYLEEELKQIDNPLVPLPPLLKAQRPEEAVIYGCYDYIVQNR